MRLAYFDCFSGISGDMALGALVDAGADLAVMLETLRRFPIEGFALEQERVDVQGITATQIHVAADPQDVILTYGAVRALLDQADIPDDARRTAQRIFRRLAESVANIQGKEVDLVTFTEYGEVDCLVDIVGCAIALHVLGVERVFASPIPTGLGMARTEHGGIMPIPSPVVMDLLQGVPTYSRGIPVELVTAPGAAILAGVSEGYGDMPTMVAETVGYGAGHLRLDFPNVIRVVIGEERRAGLDAAALADVEGDLLVEATIGDLGEDERDRLIEALLGAGARDAWVAGAIGRRGEPRANVSAVCSAARRHEVGKLLATSKRAGPVRVTPIMVQPPESPGP